jgi:lambda family phage minor tail protein L
MRTLNADFITEKNLQENEPIFLYSIINFDGASNDLNYTSWDENVTYDSVLYTAYAITHETIGQNESGEIQTISLSIGNVNRTIQAYLELYELRGIEIKIKRIFLDKVADTLAFYEDSYYVESYTANEMQVEFILTTKFTLNNSVIPKRPMSRNFCSWRFKGTECAYAGVDATCNKTLKDCISKSNNLRFGGFPSIPTRIIKS